MAESYRGACHCGLVRFEVSCMPTEVLRCHCAYCRRKGVLWHAITEAQLCIRSGKEHLREYRFGTLKARHYFCQGCGVSTFSRPAVLPESWVVNLMCVDDLQLQRIENTNSAVLH